MTKKWHLYILSCSDGSLYTGVTPDVTKRVETHNSGKGAKYTRVRLPVKVVYQEEHASRSEAQQREHAVKQLTRSQKLELIGGTLTA